MDALDGGWALLEAVRGGWVERNLFDNDVDVGLGDGVYLMKGWEGYRWIMDKEIAKSVLFFNDFPLSDDNIRLDGLPA